MDERIDLLGRHLEGAGRIGEERAEVGVVGHAHAPARAMLLMSLSLRVSEVSEVLEVLEVADVFALANPRANRRQGMEKMVGAWQRRRREARKRSVIDTAPVELAAGRSESGGRGLGDTTDRRPSDVLTEWRPG